MNILVVIRAVAFVPLLFTLGCGSTVAPDPTCPDPASGQYVDATCDSGNYHVSDCSIPGAGEYVTAPCMPGSATSIGSDTAIAACAMPGAGQFVTAACVAGTPAQAGTNTQIDACSEPAADHRTTAACVPGSATMLGTDTVIAPCSAPAADQLTTAACVPGSATMLGTDTAIAACSAPDVDHFTSAVCVGGTATITGTDTAISMCDSPIAGEYVTSACVPGASSALGTDTLFAACTVAGAAQYIDTACAAGDITTVGTDAVVADCTAITDCASGLGCTTAADSTCGACDSGFVLQSGNSVCAPLPGAPTQVTALPCAGEAYVSFAAADPNGGPAITGYTVTASPGGASASAAASPIVVPGLTNNTAYTFTVVATNANGGSVASAPSNRTTPLSAITESCGDVLFAENFEDTTSAQMTTASNDVNVVWHQELDVPASAVHFTTTKAASGTGSFHFADVTTGTYQDSTARVSGTATTSTIAVPSDGAMLRFSFYKETDGNTAQDQLSYEIINASGAVLGGPYLRTAEYQAFQTVRVPVPYDSGGVRIRFLFDSVNGTNNNFPGVFIDDVFVTKLPACASSTGAASSYRDPTSGHCYLRFETAANWDDAEQSCIDLGGHLVSVADATEDATVRSLSPENQSTWIGYTDLPPFPPLALTTGPSSPPWVWASGAPVTYTAWAPGEPNNYPYGAYCQGYNLYCDQREQDCAQMYSTGTWDDLECWSALAYVCELP